MEQQKRIPAVLLFGRDAVIFKALYEQFIQKFDVQYAFTKSGQSGSDFIKEKEITLVIIDEEDIKNGVLASHEHIVTSGIDTVFVNGLKRMYPEKTIYNLDTNWFTFYVREI